MNDIQKAMAAARQGNQRTPKSETVISIDVVEEADEYLTDSVGARPSESSDQARTHGRDTGASSTSNKSEAGIRSAELQQNEISATDEANSRSGNVGLKYSKFHELPLASLDKMGLITPNTPKNQITEEYRRIKRPLLKRLGRSIQENGSATNVLAVTSAMSGEGKTYSAINLAMSLAREKDRTVLLIDSDVVRHTAGVVFGVSSNAPGLLDLLDNDTVEPSDVILKTNVERLNFLPAGRKNALASELLSSDTMMGLIDDLSNRYQERIIVMDCPPIMQTTEAAILVDHAGQIVFVVAEEQTSQGIVMQALKLIDNEKKVGILLNKSTTHLGHYDYYNYSYS